MKVFLALALVAGILAGCSGSTTGPITPQKDAQGNYVIHLLASNQFSPKEATVPVGANVTWTNDGGALHNVVDLGSPSAFDSDAEVGHAIGAGQSFTHKFTAPGTYSYHCAYHSGMDAKLTVA